MQPASASTDDVVSPHPHLLVSPAARRLVLAMSGLLYAMGTFGSNIGPAWIKIRPLVVLALSSRNRNLFAAVPYLDNRWLPYALIGFTRVMLAGVTLFFLGRWYGVKAIEWTEGQIGELPAFYRWLRTAIDRAGWLMVFLMPGSNVVCMMAGHRRREPRRFIAVLAAGVVVKLVVLWWGGHVFAKQIKWFLDAIDGYQWWIVGGLFAISFLQAARKARATAPEVLDEIEHPHDVDGLAADPDETAAAD